MFSSFFNRSPFIVLTPLIYSMGLFNMVETGLMELVYTNIFQVKENIATEVRKFNLILNMEYLILLNDFSQEKY